MTQLFIFHHAESVDVAQQIQDELVRQWGYGKRRVTLLAHNSRKTANTPPIADDDIVILVADDALLGLTADDITTRLVAQRVSSADSNRPLAIVTLNLGDSAYDTSAFRDAIEVMATVTPKSNQSVSKAVATLANHLPLPSTLSVPMPNTMQMPGVDPNARVTYEPQGGLTQTIDFMLVLRVLVGVIFVGIIGYAVMLYMQPSSRILPPTRTPIVTAQATETRQPTAVPTISSGIDVVITNTPRSEEPTRSAPVATVTPLPTTSVLVFNVSNRRRALFSEPCQPDDCAPFQSAVMNPRESMIVECRVPTISNMYRVQYDVNQNFVGQEPVYLEAYAFINNTGIFTPPIDAARMPVCDDGT